LVNFPISLKAFLIFWKRVCFVPFDLGFEGSFDTCPLLSSSGKDVSYLPLEGFLFCFLGGGFGVFFVGSLFLFWVSGGGVAWSSCLTLRGPLILC